MNKLSFKSINIKNFRSFGDVETTFKLNDLGPILITGKNGSGKTSIIEAIIWCLFGRYSDIHNPGDSVINWDVGKNCMVRLLVNEYEIVRTRKFENHSDLLILKDGSPIENGDSTNADAQRTLNMLLNLDFNIFISSMFFGQSSGSFLNFSDQQKRRVIEKLFGLSKLECYADAAKIKIEECNKQ
jgi:DNA repair exonuclease SbcCD ATPase subunit